MVRMLRMYFTYLLTVGSSVMYLARTAKRSRCFASLLRHTLRVSGVSFCPLTYDIEMGA